MANLRNIDATTDDGKKVMAAITEIIDVTKAFDKHKGAQVLANALAVYLAQTKAPASVRDDMMKLVAESYERNARLGNSGLIV